MQGYETVIITDPDLTEEALATVLDKLKQLIADNGGAVQDYRLWGRRRLAYLINKKTHGVYHIFYLTGGKEMLAAIEQHFRYSEVIVRAQTISVENVQEEIDRFVELSKPPVEEEEEKEEKNTKKPVKEEQTVTTEEN